MFSVLFVCLFVGGGQIYSPGGQVHGPGVGACGGGASRVKGGLPSYLGRCNRDRGRGWYCLVMLMGDCLG